MKRWILIFIAIGLLFAMGASFKPIFIPGSYDVKPDGNWDLVQFSKDNYHYDQFFTFTQYQPTDLKLDLPEGKFSAYQYGRIPLGNAGNVFNFVIGNQKNFFYDTLYIDLDRNGIITPKEEVKLEEKQNIALGYVLQIFSAEVKLDVNYRLADGKIMTRPLDIRLSFVYQKNSERTITMYSIHNNTMFVGTTLAENGTPLFFGIADGDNNGCYNDFGSDIVFFDKNRDNKFDYVKESQILAELQEIKGEDRKKDIYRLSLFAWPARLVITPGRSPSRPLNIEPTP